MHSVKPGGKGGKYGDAYGFYYRNGERADAWENDPEGSWCNVSDTESQCVPCGACGGWVLLDILGEPTAKPTKIYALDDKLEFGKYKGKTLREIVKEDWGWVEWAIDQSEHFFCDIDDVINERKATIKVLSPDDVLTFGKYKGKTLREIHKEDPNYLTWVSQNANDFVIDLRSLNE